MNNKFHFTELDNLKQATRTGLIEFIRNQLFLKKIFIPFVQDAFDQMDALSNIDSKYDFENMILVHFRCGDILDIKHNSGHYGFFGLSLIERVLKQWNIDFNGEYTIYFLINLNNDRDQDSKYSGQCKYLINEIVGGIHQYLDIKFNVEIISDGTLNSDLYLLSKAKYVICGVSTFCYFGAFANINNIACIDCGQSDLALNNYYILKQHDDWFLNGYRIFNTSIGEHVMTIREILNFILKH